MLNIKENTIKSAVLKQIEESPDNAIFFLGDFARHIVEECYDIERTMGRLSYYFDYEAFARDLFMCDYFFDNGYVFRR